MSLITIGIIGVAAIAIWFIFIHPVWNVWASQKSGEADLQEANYREQIAIAEAKARLSAAELNKKAEIIDAEAVAISVETIGKALHSNDGYLRWQWIKMMDKTDNATIYVPTETNLPILEATRNLKTNDVIEE